MDKKVGNHKASAFNQIQAKMRVSKELNNAYGGFKYYNLENVLSVLKPLLAEFDARITFDTQPLQLGNSIYQVCTATYQDQTETIVSHYSSREDPTKKGMDAPQISGSAASYAKKGALANLFLIDDGSDDPDSNEYAKPQNKSNKNTNKARTRKTPLKPQATQKKYTAEEISKAQMLYKDSEKENLYTIYKKAKGNDKYAKKWWNAWFSKPNTPQGNLVVQANNFFKAIDKAGGKQK